MLDGTLHILGANYPDGPAAWRYRFAGRPAICTPNADGRPDAQSPAPSYDLEYAFARHAAMDWPPDKLFRMLGLIMRDYRHCEQMWGVIDALADLICRHEQPS